MENKPDLYNKDTKRQEIVDYCERLEFKLQQNLDFEKRFGFWLHYLAFLFGFLFGGAVVKMGVELLSRSDFEWYILLVVVIVLLPVPYYLLRKVLKK